VRTEARIFLSAPADSLKRKNQKDYGQAANDSNYENVAILMIALADYMEKVTCPRSFKKRAPDFPGPSFYRVNDERVP
jgi:hypothetical protein